MKDLRFLFLAGLVLAVGSTLGVNAQESTPKAQAQTQAQDKKSDNGHRKHWWSLPHFHHKKNQPPQAAAANTGGKAATMKPVKQTATIAGHPGSITVSEKPATKTAQVKPAKKTVASAHTSTRPVHRTVASRSHARSTTARKTVAATSHTKKAVRHNCSAEGSKNGGCQAQHSAKSATTRS